jgi:hypothetical protein
VASGVVGSGITVSAIYQKPEIVTPLHKYRIKHLPDDKKADYISILQDPLNLQSRLKSAVSNGEINLKDNFMNYSDWLDMVHEVENNLFKNSLWGSIDDFKCSAFSSLKDTIGMEPIDVIDGIIKIYGDTREAKERIDEYIYNHCENGGWLNCRTLEKLSLYSFSESKSPIMTMIINASIMCPIPISEVIEELLSDNVKDNRMSIIKKYYDGLNDKEKDYVIEKITSAVVDYTKQSGKFDKVIETGVDHIGANPLMSDIIKENKDDIIKFFSNLKRSTQTKLIKIIMVYGKDEDKLIPKMIDALGPVGIKLAQLFAEDTEVSDKWKEVINHTREHNPSSPIIDVYKNIQVHGTFTEIGKCIGVGSIKQVHFVRDADGNVNILGLKKNHCEESAKEVIYALKKIKKYRKIAHDLEKIIEGEMNFNDEKDAFNIIKTPRFIASGILDFPEVVDTSSGTIVRKLIDGSTIASTLEKEGKVKDNVKRRIGELHALLLATAFDDKLVFSDLHLGNFIHNNNTNRLTIIDIGQYGSLSDDDIMTSLWLMADVGSGKRYIHSLNMARLKNVLKIKDEDMNKVDDIFLKCYELPEIRDRLKLVMGDLHHMGYDLDESMMRICKMIDLIIQQKQLMGMEDNTIDLIENHFKCKMSYGDYLNLGYSYLSHLGN